MCIRDRDGVGGEAEWSRRSLLQNVGREACFHRRPTPKFALAEGMRWLRCFLNRCPTLSPKNNALNYVLKTNLPHALPPSIRNGVVTLLPQSLPDSSPKNNAWNCVLKTNPPHALPPSIPFRFFFFPPRCCAGSRWRKWRAKFPIKMPPVSRLRRAQ